MNTVLCRFGPRAGLVQLRQTFVRRCHHEAWRYLAASKRLADARIYASWRRRISSAWSNSRRAFSTPSCSGHFRPQPRSSHTQLEYGFLLTGLPSAWAAVASISKARAMVTRSFFSPLVLRQRAVKTDSGCPCAALEAPRWLVA